MGWLELDNHLQYEYAIYRNQTTPGNILLPTFGMCDVREAYFHILDARSNSHVFICEVPMHVLYHYVLIVLWILLVAGIVISALGLIQKVVSTATLASFQLKKHSDTTRIVYKRMTIRDVEYLLFLEKHYPDTYEGVIKILVKSVNG